MTSADPRVNELLPPIEGYHWQRALRAALSSAFTAGAITGGIYLLGGWIEQATGDHERQADDGAQAQRAALLPSDAEIAATDAAELLDVPLDASPVEIRRALRQQMATMRAHPDHGGDGAMASALIAARELLLDRSRGVAL